MKFWIKMFFASLVAHGVLFAVASGVGPLWFRGIGVMVFLSISACGNRLLRRAALANGNRDWFTAAACAGWVIWLPPVALINGLICLWEEVREWAE